MGECRQKCQYKGDNGLGAFAVLCILIASISSCAQSFGANDRLDRIEQQLGITKQEPRDE